MKQYTYDALVVGTGAAGYNTACRLAEFGVSVAIITEGKDCGTSRNTGSDKQTYYKLGLSGDTPDSIENMAQTLFSGGSCDGDTALVESALSSRAFLHLCELGVGFPTNRYGEYVGYKTDHDPFARATSVGPLTSKYMTEALEAKAKKLGIPIYDDTLAVDILKDGNTVCGLLCVKKNGKFVSFRAPNVVLCTGGPAGIYEDSVYSACHTGSTSLALRAGAKTQNMTEWQYGIASISPHWNVSGTYMQVLPRFVSKGDDGVEHEFLLDFFHDPYTALSMVFLKGYQWPFDSKKVQNGSSVIDLLVYRERVQKGRRVYLDFTKNPFGLHTIEYEKLSKEAYTYLKNADACFGDPISRLSKMNAPAVELYRTKGVDLACAPLEIAVCAQHHNGGISVDLWWQTCVEGLFAAGECAGTHGVTRPGGAALNAGQVGSLRAAQFIAKNTGAQVSKSAFAEILKTAVQENQITADAVEEAIARAKRRMSDCAGAIRNPSAMESALSKNQNELQNLKPGKVKGYRVFKLRDTLITQCAVLSAMLDFSKTVGKTRGSALYTDENGALREGLDELFRFTEDTGEFHDKIQETTLSKHGVSCTWRPVREIPKRVDVFETVWRTFREDQNIH